MCLSPPLGLAEQGGRRGKKNVQRRNGWSSGELSSWHTTVLRPELSGCDDQDETGWVNILSWRGLGGFPFFLMIQIQLTAAGEGRDVFFSGLTACMDPGFLWAILIKLSWSSKKKKTWQWKKDFLRKETGKSWRGKDYGVNMDYI